MLQTLQSILGGQANGRDSAPWEGGFDPGDLADEDLLERARRVADRETKCIVHLQHRVIEPLQRRVGDAHFHAIRPFHAIRVADAGDRATQGSGDGVAADADRELRRQAHQRVTSPVDGSVKGSEGTWSSWPGAIARGSSMPFATAMGRHSVGFS